MSRLRNEKSFFCRYCQGRSLWPTTSSASRLIAGASSVTLTFGEKGLAIMALSGADLALCDLRGKANRCPVAQLLGGVVGVPIPTYATVWGEIPEELVPRHTAFKLHVEHRYGIGAADGV